MAWIRSKLAMTSSGFLNGFNSGLFLRNQKNSSNVPSNLPEFLLFPFAFSLASFNPMHEFRQDSFLLWSTFCIGSI
jgi:hypothetical protein